MCWFLLHLITICLYLQDDLNNSHEFTFPLVRIRFLVFQFDENDKRMSSSP